MGLELKNRRLKKSKVVIVIWYASGGKKFNLQIKQKKNGSFQSRFLHLNLSLSYFARSKRSRFITLFQAATKSFTNRAFPSSQAYTSA